MKREFLFAAGLAGVAVMAVLAQPMVQTKTALNVTGKWAMVLEMSMGTGNPTLELKQDAEKLTGTYTGRYGTSKLEGTLKERAITFWFNMTAEGTSVDMSFTGEVAADGQSMKGSASIGGVGDATWTAKKEKDPVK